MSCKGWLVIARPQIEPHFASERKPRASVADPRATWGLHLRPLARHLCSGEMKAAKESLMSLAFFSRAFFCPVPVVLPHGKRILATLFCALAAVACSSGDKVTVLDVAIEGPGRVYSDDAHTNAPGGVFDAVGVDCTSDGKVMSGRCSTDLTLLKIFNLVAEPAPGHTLDHWEVDPTNGVQDYESPRFSSTSPTLPLMVNTQTSATRKVRAVFR
jgi:hypothetical protein